MDKVSTVKVVPILAATEARGGSGVVPPLLPRGSFLQQSAAYPPPRYPMVGSAFYTICSNLRHSKTTSYLYPISLHNNGPPQARSQPIIEAAGRLPIFCFALHFTPSPSGATLIFPGDLFQFLPSLLSLGGVTAEAEGADTLDALNPAGAEPRQQTPCLEVSPPTVPPDARIALRDRTSRSTTMGFRLASLPS